jgi:uncharacterized protein involved in exopolysaccharide biosynthesis
MALLQGYEIAHRTIDLLKNEALSRGQAPDTIGISEEALQKQLTVTTQSGTNLMDVSVEAESGDRAKQLANALCTTFVDYKKEVTKENARDTPSRNSKPGRVGRANRG